MRSAYTSGLDVLTGLASAVWGISPQDTASHEQFARKYAIGFPLLADAGLAVSRRYGISLGRIRLRRSVFVIDGKGVVRWKQVSLLGLSFPRHRSSPCSSPPWPPRSGGPPWQDRGMRILIMGGTAFAGRHIAQTAVDAGHDVTLFHRGRTGAALFPGASHVLGDRDSPADLAALGGSRLGPAVAPQPGDPGLAGCAGR